MVTFNVVSQVSIAGKDGPYNPDPDPILSDPFPECFFQGSMQIRLRCSFSAGVPSLMWVKMVLSSAELSLSIAVQPVQPVQNLLYQPPTQPVLDQCICLSVISEGLETGTRNTRKNGLCWTGTGWEEKDHSVSCHHRPLPDIAGVPGRDSGLLSAGQGRAGHWRPSLIFLKEQEQELWAPKIKRKQELEDQAPNKNLGARAGVLGSPLKI